MLLMIWNCEMFFKDYYFNFLWLVIMNFLLKIVFRKMFLMNFNASETKEKHKDYETSWNNEFCQIA